MKPATLRKAEWIVAVALTAIVLTLMFVRVRHAGGLWRDECAAVQLARMPTWTDVAKNFQYEAFPLLFPTIIRGYTNLFGTSDTAFQAFGFAVGALLVAALWFNAGRPGSSPPLLSLALLGLNTSVLLFATSVRGYGLGMVLILIVFGLLAKLVANRETAVKSRPAFWLWTAALVVALAAVHCLLYNSILLAAIAGAAIVVALVRRNFKLAMGLMGLAAICALSMIPYVGPYSSGREWDVLVKFPLGFPWFWKQLHTTLGSPWPGLSWIWHLVLAAVIVGGGWRLRKIWPDRTSAESDLLLMGLVAIALAVAGYFVFLKVLGYVTYAWYYLALMAILAAAMDSLTDVLARIRWVRFARLGLVIVAMVALPFAAWPKLTTRQTNMDQVSRWLEQNARPSDLIVVTPWFHGISFNWHYRGTLPWMKLPMIAEHRTHRYDLLKEKMMSPRPIDDVLGAVKGTLQAGGRVWLVGDIYPPKPGEPPVPLPPAPSPELGWSEGLYELNWVQQVFWIVQEHAVKWGTVKFPGAGRVSQLEDISLVMAEGWR